MGEKKTFSGGGSIQGNEGSARETKEDGRATIRLENLHVSVPGDPVYWRFQWLNKS